jgi:anti-anti-sigma factor
MPPTTNIPAQDVNPALAAIACLVSGLGHLMSGGDGPLWQAVRTNNAEARRSHRRHAAAGARRARHPAMTADHRAPPLPGCPARRSDGTDVCVAEFFLVVHDCFPCGSSGRPATTEVFSFFGQHRALVDLTGCPYLDAAGLAVITTGLARTRAHSGELVIACGTEPVLKVFCVTGLVKVLPIFGSAGDAARALAGVVAPAAPGNAP